MEFGSDFDLINYPKGNGLPFRMPYNLYSSGRQALHHLVKEYEFDTIWIPTYYCGESIDFLYSEGYAVKRYSCIPTDNPTEIFRNIPIRENDLLMRFNYFGLYGFQDNSNLHCRVIEDHSHSLMCDWAKESNADWCFASLRKTLPIADGGILWSPKGHQLPEQPTLAVETSTIMKERYLAMSLKTQYLNNLIDDKSVFLSKFRETEEQLGNLKISDISSPSLRILSDIDVEDWFMRKRENIKYLIGHITFKKFAPLSQDCNTIKDDFSLVVLFDTEQSRDEARRYLISKGIYPAVLWADVDSSDSRAVDFSKKILSIHCDGRYSIPEMEVLSKILNQEL